ncbi:hypothetical protein ACFQ9D_12050 [Arthrobacter koreensis]|uniref:hypothetical protein n=1 Tax=Arthrobacter koreensis TaxID=199136 RepID=UPI003630699B
MERKEIASARSRIARSVAMLMADADFVDDLVSRNVLDADGEIPIVIASENESAILTVHRIERVQADRVILVTDAGPNKLGIIQLKKSPASRSDGDAVADLVSGMTVRDWLDMARMKPGHSFVISSEGLLMESSETSLYEMAGSAPGPSMF